MVWPAFCGTLSFFACNPVSGKENLCEIFAEEFNIISWRVYCVFGTAPDIVSSITSAANFTLVRRDTLQIQKICFSPKVPDKLYNL